MTWILLLWSLRILITLFNILSSFKSLKLTTKRIKRVATIEKEILTGKITLTSTERLRRRNIKAQLTTWIVWVTFCAIERISDKTIGFILPLYDEIKVIILLFILTCRSTGAEIIFKKVLKPLITPYERPLDGIGFLAYNVLNLLVGGLLLLPNWIRKNWFNNERVDEVPSIMIALRVPTRPPLSHNLADSIELAQQQQHKPIKSKPQLQSNIEVPITHPRRVPTSNLSSLTSASTSKLSSSQNNLNTTSIVGRGSIRPPASTGSNLNQLSKSINSRPPLSNTSRNRNSSSSNSIQIPSTSSDKNMNSDLTRLSSIPTPFDQSTYRSLQQQQPIIKSSHQLKTSISQSNLKRSQSSSVLPIIIPSLPSPIIPSTAPSPTSLPPPNSFTFSSPHSHIPFVLEPPTPAPPGAFNHQFLSNSNSSSSSSSIQTALKNSIIDSIVSTSTSTSTSGNNTPSITFNSPREKATWAIRNLGKDLDLINHLEPLNFNLNKNSNDVKGKGRELNNKRNRNISSSNENLVDDVEDSKIIKKSKKVIDLLKDRKGKKVDSVEDEEEYIEGMEGDEEEERGEDGSTTTSTTSTISKRSISTSITSNKRNKSSPTVNKKSTTIKSKPVGLTKKKKVINSQTNSNSNSEDEEFSLPVPKSKLKLPSTTTTSSSVSSLKPPSLSTSVRGTIPSSTSLSTSTSRRNLLSTSISRNTLSTSTSTSNLRSSRSNNNLSSSTSRMNLANNNNSSSTSSNKEKEKLPERKKPRRVLLGVVKHLDGSEDVEDGVPVARRRRV